MCFYQLFTDTRVSEDFQFQVYGSWNNWKHTALVRVYVWDLHSPRKEDLYNIGNY